MMNTVTGYLAADHRQCDAQFADAEAGVAGNRWDLARTELEHFLASMGHHFAMEEQVLFPEFEQRTGNHMGPTRMMRMEHEQMRQLFDELSAALESRDAVRYLGASETLLVMMQQHNIKEEQVLYPLTDQVLGRSAAGLLERMQGLHGDGQADA